MHTPDAIRERLRRRWDRLHRAWLDEAVAHMGAPPSALKDAACDAASDASTDAASATRAGVDPTWPMRLALGPITERDVTADPAAVREWIDAWQRWRGAGTLHGIDRRWRQLGDQRLPDALQLDDAAALAAWVDQSDRWQRALGRGCRLAQRWPVLRGRLGRHFAALADEPDDDFERLTNALDWLQAHPASGLYLRELPIEGLDSKWLERHAGLVRPLLAALIGREGDDASQSLVTMAGLRSAPARARLRVLCPVLRASVGGLHDLEVPLDDLASLAWRPRGVLVVENLASGLALPDLPGVVAFIGLGRAAVTLSALPWVGSADVDVVVWGDLDTHGLGIVAQMRRAMPRLRSVMMDVPTLTRYRHLAVREPVQDATVQHAWLTPSERAALDALQSEEGWARGLRLEQERLPWAEVTVALREALTV